MHIFLQGLRNIGKSTIIRKTLEILSDSAPLTLGGFFTWNAGSRDPHIYMRPALNERVDEIYRIASYDSAKGGMVCDLSVFEQTGVRLLSDSLGSDIIIMDELGFLESAAPAFRQAVLETLAGSVPVFGVLRLGDIPWHSEIKRIPNVAVFDVNEENRDKLPQELAARIKTRIPP